MGHCCGISEGRQRNGGGGGEEGGGGRGGDVGGGGEGGFKLMFTGVEPGLKRSSDSALTTSCGSPFQSGMVLGKDHSCRCCCCFLSGAQSVCVSLYLSLTLTLSLSLQW